MTKVKVVMSKNSLDVRAGDTISVDQEVADELLANGHAVLASDAKPKGKE